MQTLSCKHFVFFGGGETQINIRIQTATGNMMLPNPVSYMQLSGNTEILGNFAFLRALIPKHDVRDWPSLFWVHEV